MKSKEEIEQLADEKYLQRAEAITDSTIKGYIVSATKGGYVDGYTQCQEDMAKNYTEAEIQLVLDGFTNEAPGKYIKTNFIELLNKQD